MDNYEDILNLPHHISTKHPQMSRENRAAQFAPFAALTGYDASVREEARLTSSKLELSDEQNEMLNVKIAFLCEFIQTKPAVSVTYFTADSKKDGGAYVTEKGSIHQIDEHEGVLIFTDKRKIPLADILTIDSEVFPKEILKPEF